MENRLCIKYKGEINIVSFSEIIFIERTARTVHVYVTGGKKHTYYEKFENLLDVLPQNFVQCHRSFIVNVSKIASIKGDTILFNEEGLSVPLGRSFKSKFLKSLR